jgi:GTP-binding protein
VLLTKSDKLRRGPGQAALLSVRRQLEALHPQATVQLFSSHTGSGVGELTAVLDGWLADTGAGMPAGGGPDPA